MTEFNNWQLIPDEFCQLWIFKNISSPGTKAFKSRYRDVSRRLRNTALVGTKLGSRSEDLGFESLEMVSKPWRIVLISF